MLKFIPTRNAGEPNILQIRASVFSKSWNDKWDKVEDELYTLVA